MSLSNYNLRWDAFQNNLCDGFAYLQQKSEFVDMTLAADGHFVQVHQSIVALASPFLKSLLKSLTCPHPVIYLDVSHEVLGYLLEYMYAGELILPPEKCKEFVNYGRKLKMFGLEKLPNNYDEPLIIEKVANEAPINQDNVINMTQNSGSAIEILQDIPQEASSTMHDAIINQTLQSQTLNSEPIIVPATQDVATIPKQKLHVSNKLMNLLETVENYEFTENDVQSDIKIAEDTNIPLSGFNLSPNINGSSIAAVESSLYTTTTTNGGTHQDMPLLSNIHIDTQVSDTFQVDTQVSNDFENIDFFKSPNDMALHNTAQVESTSKEAQHMSIDDNNETMNSIDTVLEFKLLGDFSIAGGKKQAPVDNDIKDDPWDMFPIKNVVDLNHSDDESNTENGDKLIDVEEELDKINRKNNKMDVSSLPNLDNETLFDDSFRKDSDLEMSDEDRGEPMAPIKHSSPEPQENVTETRENAPEIEVSVFGKVIKKIEVNPKQIRENPIIQYTLSNRDSLQLIVNRFIYSVHHNSGEKRRRWRCVDYRRKHCLAFVDTDGETLVKRANAHNHVFHDVRIGRQIRKNKVFSSVDAAVTFRQNRIRRYSKRRKTTIDDDDDDE